MPSANGCAEGTFTGSVSEQNFMGCCIGWQDAAAGAGKKSGKDIGNTFGITETSATAILLKGFLEIPGIVSCSH